MDVGPEKQFSEALSSIVDGSRVLVVGCGTGKNVQNSITAGATEVVGIELSSKRLCEASKAIAANSVEFARADGEELPFRSGKFDIVICHSVLHHLPNWRTDGLEEICRVLTAKGQLLLYEPGRYNPPAVIRRRFFPSDIHTPDEHPFDPSELERVLSKNFETVEISGHCIISNTIPVIAKYLPINIPIMVTERAYNLEQPIVDGVGRRFAWVLTGVAGGPRSQY
ncbi:hypothetical protein C435_20943 [Haloarcula marismortui ATCC 33799]|uniref:Methyltransferase type 11 domain-containing protein n=2 Tax=Haloarcula marismortui TaxID=2238 RepID=M0JM84_9EURY|nr:hypothetical protein C435_20943 [Haloarcula californiae ATCC 33799]